MCGIFGVRGRPRRGRPDAARPLFAAASRTGIGRHRRRRRRGRRARCASMGLVSDMPRRAAGGAARRHRPSATRATAPPARRPSRTRSRCSSRRAGGYISLAHNGNLTNAGELRAELEDHGLDLRLDQGFRGHRASARALHAPNARKIGSPTRCTASRARTACSSSMGDTLLAARDPRGWRPLVMGRLDGSPVFASETCALDIVGATLRARRRAGRDLRRRRDGVRSIFPFERCSCKRCVFEYVYFARPDSRIFGGSVDRARRALGRRLARECPAPGRGPRVQRPRLVELRGARLRRGERVCPTSSR